MTKVQQPIILDDLPSYDEWITEIEEPVLPQDGAWLNVLDRSSRRYTREASQRTDESNDNERISPSQHMDVEVQELSDNEVENAIACVALNEDVVSGNLEGTFNDDAYIGDDDNAATRTTGTDIGSNDFFDDENFSYDD